MYEGGDGIRISHLQYLPHLALTHQIGRKQRWTHVNVVYKTWHTLS